LKQANAGDYCNGGTCEASRSSTSAKNLKRHRRAECFWRSSRAAEIDTPNSWSKATKTRAVMTWRNSGAHLYPGRFTCHDVQVTGEGEDRFATFTLTAEEVAGAAESQLVWTDQDVQRGIRPDVPQGPPRELSVGNGYPDPKLYIFDAAKANDIAEKLLRGDKLFLSRSYGTSGQAPSKHSAGGPQSRGSRTVLPSWPDGYGPVIGQSSSSPGQKRKACH
jgi:hypothetical protein